MSATNRPEVRDDWLPYDLKTGRFYMGSKKVEEVFQTVSNKKLITFAARYITNVTGRAPKPHTPNGRKAFGLSLR